MRRILLSVGAFLIMITVLTGCSSAGNYNKAGKKSFLVGDYGKAAECFSSAITANPNRADYYIDYGIALIALGRYEDAIKQFDLAYMDKDMLVIRENDKRVLRGKGIAYFNLLQYEKAIDSFESALKIDELSGLDVDILHYIAASYKMTGAYDMAIKAYTSLISIDDGITDAYAQRAFCYQCSGDYGKSLADYDSAISLKPKNYEYYFGKYYLMTENGDEAGAAAVLSSAEKIKAVSDEDKYNLAKLHYLQGQYDTSLSEFNKSYADGFTESYYYIGEINRCIKDYEQAVYYYENYIANGEISSPNVYNQIAACLIKMGKYAEALDYLEQGMAYINSGAVQTFLKNEIIAYENLGRYEEAKQKTDEYLAYYPGDKDALKEAEFIMTRMTKEDAPE